MAATSGAFLNDTGMDVPLYVIFIVNKVLSRGGGTLCVQ
ncbi:MAG: hypothetical protein ACJAUG_002897 [Halioglobus sp.]|jgi:hypothetical protein